MALYLSTPLVQINGTEYMSPSKIANDILQVIVEESIHLPGMFTLVINNPYAPGDTETKTWQYDKDLKIGNSVKIGFVASTTEAPEFQEEHQDYDIIEGEITAIETHFSTHNQAPIVVRGYDISHRLHRGRYSRSFQNMTDSDIVQKIIKDVPIDPGQIDPSGDPNPYVFQENQTNMEFLQERAARLGFELFVQGSKLYFRKPQVIDEPLNLQWQRDIKSFRARVSSAEQVESVEVRGWDYSQKLPILSKKQTEQIITTTQNGKGSDTSQKFGSIQPSMIVVDKPVFTQGQADVMAQALCNELGGEFVYADAQAPGDPRIQVGKAVNLSDMGSYSGKYYVTESRHVYYQGVYTTEFSVRGLRGGSMLDTLSPRTHLKPGQTHLVGIVTDIDDDPATNSANESGGGYGAGSGRVRVRFPTLNPDENSDESWWARVVAPGAGQNRGFFCLPEIGDEVLVAFEHGDIHRPYVLGGVWNGKDPTPETVRDTIPDGGPHKGRVRLRTFRTRTSHILQFVETDYAVGQSPQTGIYIYTSGGAQSGEAPRGHKILLNDSDESIEIDTKGGHKIRMDDRSRTISINSTGMITMDAPEDISIKAGGAVNISAGVEISLSAGADINLSAAAITAEAEADINLSAAAITAEAGEINVAGNTTFEGAVEIIGELAALNITAVSIETEALVSEVPPL